MKDEFNQLLEKINKAKNIGIISHKIPDADAIGSSCGLAYAFREMGKNVEVLFEKPLKDEYDIFKLNDIISNKPSFEYDLFISTDSGDTSRFSIFEPLYVAHKNTINIDHHITNKKYAKLNYVDANRSSACEYIFYILNELNIKMPMKTQRLLYVGVIRDCGAFMYSNTTSNTHRIVAQMIENGVDYALLNEHFMQTTALKTIILQKYALNSMELLFNNRVCIMNLPLSVFQKEHCVLEDTASIVSIGSSIQGVDLSIMISEVQPNVHKISFRSKNDIDASELALTFGGGGHMRASGCQLKGAFSRVYNQLIKAVEKLINKGE